MSNEISIYHRIENLQTAMDNLESLDGVEVTFSHEEAFQVEAHIRAVRDTDMNQLAAIDSILTNHGFEEKSHEIGGANEWTYSWHHGNY